MHKDANPFVASLLSSVVLTARCRGRQMETLSRGFSPFAFVQVRESLPLLISCSVIFVLYVQIVFAVDAWAANAYG